MKKKIYLMGLIILTALLFGCNNNTPKGKVERLLMNYQNNNDVIISELEDYLNSQTSDVKTFNAYKEVYLRQYNDLTYQIKDETIDGDNATVTAQIEVYDYYKTETDSNNYITLNPDEFSSDGTYDSNKALDYRTKKLNNAKERVTYTITFNLTKVNNEWTIDNLSTEDLEKIHGIYMH